MSEHDKNLIKKAERISRYLYRQIDKLIDEAESQEAIDKLKVIRWDKYDLMLETL